MFQILRFILSTKHLVNTFRSIQDPRCFCCLNHLEGKQAGAELCQAQTSLTLSPIIGLIAHKPTQRETWQRSLNLSLSFMVTLKKNQRSACLGLILTALQSRVHLIFKQQNLEIDRFSSSGSEFLLGSRTKHFRARGLILWQQAFHICPKGML